MRSIQYTETKYMLTVSEASNVRAHLFCHPEVNVFCQGQAL